jgi:hypothetical protein
VNNRRAARAVAPNLLLIAYLAMNAFAVFATLSTKLPDDDMKAGYNVLFQYVIGNGNGVLLLVGSLLFLHDAVISHRSRRLIGAATLVGLGQVVVVASGFAINDWSGRTAGQLGSQLAFVLACALVSAVAWQPTRTEDTHDGEAPVDGASGSADGSGSVEK